MRVAEPDDAPALAAFGARTFADTYGRRQGGDPVAASRPEDVAAYVAAHFTPDWQRAELADPTLVTFVAAAAGGGPGSTWAGYAQLRLVTGPDAPTPAACGGAAPRELARLYVDPAWHGRGVADALVDAVQARALAAPGEADPLWLAVYQANARAVAFYRRRGFRIVGEADFWLGAELQRDWLMAWRP